MASGTINGTTSNQYITVRADWTATADETLNRSTVSVSFYARKSSSSSEATTGKGTWYLYVDGQATTFTKRVTLSANNQWILIGSTTKTVNHAADGTKSITISATGSIASTTYTSTSLSGTAVMDAIPRETRPTFSVSEAEFGDTITITLNRAESTFTHAVYYTWNGTTTLIDDDVATSLSFTIPAGFISDIPNAASAPVVFTVITYREDGSEVGTTTGSVVCTVPASAAPIINSVTLTDSGTSIPAAWGVFANGLSVLHVKVNASGQYGATISSVVISALDQTVAGNDVDIATIYTSGTVNIAVTVTDSRGLSTSNSTAAALTVYDYAAPVIESFSVVRCNSYGTAVENGTSARVGLKCSISSLGGNNAMEIRLYHKRSDASSWTLANTVTPGTDSVDTAYVIQNAIDTSYTYGIRVEVQDALNTSWQEGTLSAEGAIMSWISGGRGVAFGKVAETANEAEFAWLIHGKQGAQLDVALPVASGGTGADNAGDALTNLGALDASGTWDVSHLTATATSAVDFVTAIKAAIVDAIYPVGSIYISTDSASPEDTFGGTWQKIEDRFLLAAGTNYSAGTQGGAASQAIANHQHVAPIGSRNSNGAAAIMFDLGYETVSSGTARAVWSSSNNTGSVSDIRAPYTGIGGAHTVNTMPPYLAVYVWERTA